MSDRLVTERELEGILRRLNALETRLEREKSEVPITASGTWTPAYKGETTPGATTYTTQYGVYARFGNTIIAVGYVVWTAATGTGNANITLPFTAANIGNQIVPIPLYVDGVTFGAGSPMAVVIPNTTFFRLYYPTSNAATTIIQVEAAGQVAFTATYFI